MNDLLRRLLRLWFRPVDEPTPEPADAAEIQQEADDLADLIPDADSATAAPAEDAETPRERASRERAERAESEARDLRARAPAPPLQQGRDPVYEQEEEQLRQAQAAGADETTMRWLRFQVNTNRDNRESRRIASQAERRSLDAADSSQFQAIVNARPELRKYATQVEKYVQDAMQSGQPFAPRALYLRMVLGDAVMNKQAKPAAKKKADDAPTKTVDRGRPAMSRSDVSGRGGARDSDREARRKRLENQPI